MFLGSQGRLPFGIIRHTGDLSDTGFAVVDEPPKDREWKECQPHCLIDRLKGGGGSL